MQAAIQVRRSASLLLVAKFSDDYRSPAAVRILGKVILHAGLDSAAAGLDARTSTLDICLAGFDDIYIAQQSLLASLGKLRKVLLDAPLDPAVAGFDFGAILLDFRATGLAHFRLLRYGSRWSKQKNGSKEAAYFAFHVTLRISRPCADQGNRWLRRAHGSWVRHTSSISPHSLGWNRRCSAFAPRRAPVARA